MDTPCPNSGSSPDGAIRVSPLLLTAAAADADGAFRALGTSADGLTDEEAERRRAEYGRIVVVPEDRHGRLAMLGRALVNPLVVLLALLAAVSFLTGDDRAGTVIVVMVLIGVVLRFVQEARADAAAAELKALIRVTATVLRGGQPREVRLEDLVPGDVVQLSAGDMIPADLRVIACKNLYVVQASLTGEAFPVEKSDAPEERGGRTALELRNVCFLGTSVESGTARGLVAATGRQTYMGGMAGAIVQRPAPTGFDRGVSRFTWLMIRFVLVMVPLVFLINGLTKGDWRQAFFFATAVAVGLTPEMLPMIVTVCLSRGAVAMSRKRVIVKRLGAIQNLGAMDVLCTDKTGTLTQDRVILERHCDVVLKEDEEVLALAFLNSHFQTGLKNLMDRAILEHTHLHERLAVPEHEKVDEIPFDFSRRVMSVVVKTPEGRHRLICKGAPEEVFRRCTRFALDGELLPMDHALIQDLRDEYDDLGRDGFRVLAVAYKDLDPRPAYAREDEAGLTLRGYVAFLDPPKESALPAIRALHEHGVAVKVLTGDNELVSRKICRDVGLAVDRVVLGTEVEGMTDAELAAAAGRTVLFARLSPDHKRRVIRALRARGHVVGFLGDGTNDAPAMRAADVGVSVDTAVDIAKEAADAILLEKSLMVLDEGVVEGRKVFVNILKYIRMGASSNFGNMFSVLGASVFLPFVPMAPIQILANNLLYDVSQVPIPTDNVDPDQVARPRPWSIGRITRFILFVGPCSSVFDYTTFFIMLHVFGCWDPSRASLFQTGWFVESLLTQTLIIHIIRTDRVPLLQSRASRALTIATIGMMLVGLWLPYSPLAPALGFHPLPGLYWPLLLATLTGYVLLTQGVKSWLFRRGWVRRADCVRNDRQDHPEERREPLVERSWWSLDSGLLEGGSRECVIPSSCARIHGHRGVQAGQRRPPRRRGLRDLPSARQRLGRGPGRIRLPAAPRPREQVHPRGDLVGVGYRPEAPRGDRLQHLLLCVAPPGRGRRAAAATPLGRIPDHCRHRLADPIRGLRGCEADHMGEGRRAGPERRDRGLSDLEAVARAADSG
jgi:Mg2+-importing ATPase